MHALFANSSRINGGDIDVTFGWLLKANICSELIFASTTNEPLQKSANYEPELAENQIPAHIRQQQSYIAR
jgi:hypothetical protein